MTQAGGVVPVHGELRWGGPLIHDPKLVNKYRAGTATESGCTACNRCIVMMYSPGGTSCVLREPNDPKLNQTPAAA
jgi:hypothetical protein